jgi:C4-type Zn-finger protein
MEQASANSTSAFKKLDASEEALTNETSGVTELDSICMNCYKQGRTKLLLTRIPFYRDVVISSFACEHCNLINNGIESANKIQEKGVRYKLTVQDAKDMNRQLVKSDSATFHIPSIELEIPPYTQKGCNGIKEITILLLKYGILIENQFIFN